MCRLVIFVFKFLKLAVIIEQHTERVSRLIFTFASSHLDKLITSDQSINSFQPQRPGDFSIKNQKRKTCATIFINDEENFTCKVLRLNSDTFFRS